MTLDRPARIALALAGALGLVAAPFATSPARAVTAAEMQDLPQDHWAFKAIQQLTERYGVMEGFPDATFRGTKTVTRYELAAALTKVMQKMDAMAGGVPATAPVSAVPPADQATVGRLRTEFAKELADLDARVKKGEDGLKELQDKLGKMVTVKGSVNTLLGDETLDIGKDRTAPYISTALQVGFKGNISESTSYDTSIGGTIKASGSGDVPAVMSGALGKTPTADTINVKSARVTSKVGAATINVGRFPLWLVGFGPSTDQTFRTGDFAVGVGALGPDASALRVGSDVGATVEAPLGPVTVSGGVNSNIVIAQLGATFGPVGLKAGFETDHKAITQQLLNTTQRVKTSYNTAAVLDVGGEGPVGGTLQLNVTNDAITQYGGGLRTTLAGIDLNATVSSSSDPGKSVDVLSYGAAIGFPAHELFGGRFKTPSILIAGLDNYTINAPSRAGATTTGPGGQALGKNAGVSVQLGLENPLIPGLILEYNAQAKLIEDIFIPNAADPITSESILMKSTLKF